MTENTLAPTDFTPLSISPAEPGWRALYLPDGGGQDYEVVPLVAWGVFAVDGGATGNKFAGVVADRTYHHRVRYLICAEDRNAASFPFASYLAPGVPEPIDDPDAATAGHPERPFVG